MDGNKPQISIASCAFLSYNTWLWWIFLQYPSPNAPQSNALSNSGTSTLCPLSLAANNGRAFFNGENGEVAARLWGWGQVTLFVYFGPN